jgi:hypothetical protein
MPIDPGTLGTLPGKIPSGLPPTKPPVVTLAGRVTLRIDGTARPELDALVIEWLLEERINCPARFELVVQNLGPSGLRFEDRRLFEFGKSVEVLGPGGASLFKGLVFAIGDEFAASTAPRARLVAADRLERLAATRRTRSFNGVSDKDVILRIAREHGLVATVNLSAPTRPSVSQLDCSDLDVLRQIAERCDARLRMDDTRLLVQPFDHVDLPPRTYSYGQDLQSFAASADLRGQPTAVQVGGWSVAAGSAVSASATPAPADFDVPGGDSGASIGAAAFGAAVHTLAAPGAGSADEVTAQARTLMAAKARRFVSAQGRIGALAEGLHAGSVVNLAGLGPLHSGRYRITALRRRFDTALGPYAEFEALRNSIGRP